MPRTVSTCLVAGVMFALLASPEPASGGSAVDAIPYPVAAGQSVTVQYDPADRVLDGASPVYLHYGFNDWNPAVSPDPTMSWNAAESVWEATVDVPINASQLDVVFRNGSGTWDDNDHADWHLFVVATSEQWNIDGQLDEDAMLVAENNGYALYAGVRGTILYVAAPGASGGNDHFIFVAGTPGSLVSAPWDKDGLVAAWSAYIGNEVDNGWVGWFNASGSTEVATGTWVEGTIDLAAELGSMPDEVYLAFAPYPTADGSSLQYPSQVPASVNGDGHVDAAEYVQIDVDSIRVGCSPFDLNKNCNVDTDGFGEFRRFLVGPRS
jgi:hypothetical protein